jgi:adenosylcobinamide kinase/adenosylcobinamide-phosphate guanylyltransferase
MSRCPGSVKGFFNGKIMGRIIFITGAVRSGKSQFAVELAGRLAKGTRAAGTPKGTGKVIFIATCVPEDGETKRRVKLHKRNRPFSWKTVEGEIDILKSLQKIKKDSKGVIIIDCLTLFISGLLLKGFKEREIKKKTKEIVEVISGMSPTTIVVSNEVGSGIVPENKLARQFRDLVGIANQMLSRGADEVYFMVAGIPIKIKDPEENLTGLTG